MMENVMKSWNELSRKEQLAATHYDFYKDVHGVRPRWMNYDAMTEQELEQELDQLSREAEVQRIEEEKMQKIATEKFELRVADLITSGAKDRATALRWIHDAEDSNGDDEYLCFLLGLPYGYFREVA
jgi:dipeptidase